MKIDFFARRVHFVDHMAPVWKELSAEAKGSFFVPESIIGHAVMRGVEAVGLKARSGNALDVVLPHSPSPLAPLPTPRRAGQVGEGKSAVLVCAYGDLAVVKHVDPWRKVAFMEHGVGIGYIGHPGYAGGKGMRARVNLFLAPNEYIRAKTERALPGVKQVVIGTPKLDVWGTPHPSPLPLGEGGGRLASEKAVVCISFHWNGEKVSPEAGNAFAHYKSVLPALTRSKYFTLIGHAHPRAMEYFAKIYEELGVEVVRDFDEVMQRADVYVCDNSSTIYEFCVTGKPVIILNAPWFRKTLHTGIRFWEWTDIGPQVEKPETLMREIDLMLWWPESYAEKRRKMVGELYPFLGESARRGARAIEGWLMENGS